MTSSFWSQLFGRGRGSRSAHAQLHSHRRPFRTPLTLEGLEGRCLLSANALDFTFNGTGKLVLPPSAFGGGSTALANAAVVQSDGKIVVAGQARTAPGGPFQSVVVRLNPNGSLDTAFNGTGIQVNALTTANGSIAKSVALQSDGKIVVAGSANNGSSTDMAVVRLNPDGSLDPTFSGTGKRTITFPGFSGATRVAVQSDGKIVLGGTTFTVGEGRNFAAARLNPDGSLDTSFNGTGLQSIGFNLGGNNDDLGQGMAIQSDGKIVLGGSAKTASGSEFAIARLNTNGTLDITFNGTGEQAFAFNLGGTNGAEVEGLAVQSDGKIVLGGDTDTATGLDFAVARLTADGSLDPAFNGTGRQTVAFNLGGDNGDGGTDVALQSNGRIVIAGSAEIAPANADFAVARLNPDGSLDATFNGTGKQTVGFDLGDNNDEAIGVALQGDGKIVLVGQAFVSASGSDFAIARVVDDKPNVFVTGADAGGGPDVKVFDALTATLKFGFFAYDPKFTGGVRVAAGDVNGDGVPDTICAAGPGGGPNVTIFDGKTGQRLPGPLGSFFAYDMNFTGGVYVAAGDINRDGFADIICGADAGGGPNVTVFNGKDGTRLMSFFAYDMNFTGGVRVSAGDVNGDGLADIVCGAGPGGGPNVTVFSGKDGTRLLSFFAYNPGFTAGIYVAAGDVDGDGKSDILTGAGPGGGPNVAVFSGLDGHGLFSFFPYDPGFTGGVRVASADRNGDGKDDFISVPGPGGGPDVRIFDAVTLAQLDQFFAYDPLFTGGLYVAANTAS